MIEPLTLGSMPRSPSPGTASRGDALVSKMEMASVRFREPLLVARRTL
jgi:hypothetical protein